MTSVQFKALTHENLLEPDPLTMCFGNALDLTTGEIREMTRNEFLSYIFRPRLSDTVPEEVINLFEAGRAAMCYGYYVYPLFMLGFERSCGAGEAAVRHRARQLGATTRSSFAECVNILVKQEAVSEQDKGRWDAIRTIRNEAAHPKFEQVMMPGPCIEMLVTVAEAINHLFSTKTT